MTRSIPHVLIPWNPAEAMSVAEAAALAYRSVRTVRDWAARYDIGRRVAGEWVISRVALLMLLESDQAALSAYLRGEREAEPVADYYRRLRCETAGLGSKLTRVTGATCR